MEDVIEKIKECYTAWELPFIDEGIDREHIAGKEYLEIQKKSQKRSLNQYLSWKIFI